MMNFDKAFERVVGHEGKFQAHRNDRGNWTSGKVGVGELKGTKFGIAAHSYPHLDIKSLTITQAKEIYLRDFWLPLKPDRLDSALVYQLFDASFNHGIRSCNKMLQRAVGVVDDGVIGSVSVAKIVSLPVSDVLKKFLGERIRFMVKQNNFSDFGKGWMIRIADNLDYAAEDTIE